MQNLQQVDAPSHEPRLRWYAIRTRPQHEFAVARTLRLKGYEQLLPTYQARVKWVDRVKIMEKPLFPGYLFSHFDARMRVPIMNTPGVIDIVRIAGHPAPVEDAELSSLKIAMESGYTCVPWPRAESGQHVSVGFGPLAGVSGVVVQAKGKTRVILSVSVVNRAILVEVDARDLAPEAMPPTHSIPDHPPSVQDYLLSSSASPDLELKRWKAY